MYLEPSIKHAVVFIDGQNLFHAAKEAFSYKEPNYDLLALSELLCKLEGWKLSQVRFYSGIPDPIENPRWHSYWIAKLAAMGHRGVEVFSRPLRYRDETVKLPDGTTHTFRVGREKDIDVRIALDVIRLAHRKSYDVGVIFSQDQDLSEVAEEIRVIATEQNRWIRLASAYPVSSSRPNHKLRGINKTDWKKIEKSIL